MRSRGVLLTGLLMFEVAVVAYGLLLLQER